VVTIVKITYLSKYPVKNDQSKIGGLKVVNYFESSIKYYERSKILKRTIDLASELFG